MKTVEAVQKKDQSLLFAATFLLSCVGLFLLHSNALFTCVYFLVPWCIHEIRSAKRCNIMGHGTSSGLLCLLFVLLVILILVGLYKLPLMQGVVTFYWALAVDPVQEILNILTLNYVGDFYPKTMQPILGALVVAGCVLVLKNRDLRWTAVSYIIAVVVCFGEAVLPAPWKNYFSGFWYTDPFRVAAMASIFAMPLAAYALASLFAFIRRMLSRSDEMHQPGTMSKAVALLFMLALIVLNHVGSFTLPTIGQLITPFGAYRTACRNLYDMDNQPLTASEHEFIEQAKRVVGDSVVLSYPGNGTAAAYGLDRINTLYRTATPASSPDAMEDADGFSYDQAIIATEADAVASDSAVRDAMESVGAKYVLILPSTVADYEYDRFADQASYAGLLAVDDGVPGYRLVMEEDGMKLLEITAVEE